MSKGITLFAGEKKLASIIWRDAPMTSPELVAVAERELNWKKSTTYTVLKKLCNKGVFRNDNANVTVLLTLDELVAHQSRHFVEETFGGSLPGFITSFIGRGKLTQEQAAELRRLIEAHERGDTDG
jgi:predicted transcriptional regulator